MRLADEAHDEVTGALAAWCATAALAISTCWTHYSTAVYPSVAKVSARCTTLCAQAMRGRLGLTLGFIRGRALADHLNAGQPRDETKLKHTIAKVRSPSHKSACSRLSACAERAYKVGSQHATRVRPATPAHIWPLGAHLPGRLEPIKTHSQSFLLLQAKDFERRTDAYGLKNVTRLVAAKRHMQVPNLRRGVFGMQWAEGLPGATSDMIGKAHMEPCSCCGQMHFKEDLKRCSACKTEPAAPYYCSQGCQKKDWRRHKEQCRFKSAKNQ